MAIHTYQMAINYNAGGQFASNILHFTMDDGGFTTTAAAATGLCQGWDNANRVRLKNMLPAAVTLLSYRARAVNVAGGFEGGVLLPAGQVGARAGSMNAAGVGPVVILYPTGNGPQRGRIFLPGITENDADDGMISEPLKTVITTSMSGIITSFPTVGGGVVAVQPVIYHRKAPPATFNIALSQVSMMIGQIRRRQLPA